MERRSLILAIASAALLCTALAVRSEESTSEATGPQDAWQLLMEISRTEGAERLSLLDRFLKEYPEHEYRGRVASAMAELLIETGRSEEAIRLLEKELERSPLPELKQRLADSLLQENRDLERAERLASEAVQAIRPYDPAAKPAPTMPEEDWKRIHRAMLSGHLGTLGRVQLARGKHAEAEVTLREALELRGAPDLTAALATALEKQDKTDEAFQILDAFLRDDPQGNAAIRARHRALFLARGGSEEAYRKQEVDRDDRHARAREAKLRAELVDREAPDFKVKDLADRSLSLDSFKGKVLVLNFWATWCPPCRAELPQYQKAFEALDGKGIAFLAVSTDQERDARKIPRYLEKEKLTFPVTVSPETARAYGVRSIPQMVIIDPEGRIRFEKSGYDPRENLVETLRLMARILQD